MPVDGPVRCEITVDRDVLTPLRRAPAAPPPRIRVVGAPTGVDGDRAELISDHLIVRLRPDGGEADLTGVEAGLHAVERFGKDGVGCFGGLELCPEGAEVGGKVIGQKAEDAVGGQRLGRGHVG